MSRWAAPLLNSNSNKQAQLIGGLQSELAKRQSHTTSVNTTSVSGNIASNSEKISGANPVVDHELTRLLNELLGLQKVDHGVGVENAHTTEAALVPTSTNDTIILQDDEVTSTSGQTNQATFKTPDNPITKDVQEVGPSRKIRKAKQHYQQHQDEDIPVDDYPASGSVSTSGGEITVNEHTTPKVVQENGAPPYYDSVLEKSKTLKRALNNQQGNTTDKTAKYLRIDGDEGRIISAYFTPGNDEKLQDFRPVYINVGNPKVVKEIVGVRKNTQFCATGGKGKAKSSAERISYLVVSFENRKKPTSPFVEYPLNKLGSLIKALQDLKQHAIKEGYYHEGTILNCTYPEDTIIMPGDSKDTLLELNE